MTYHVAVIGAGPAGIFGARELANLGVKVALFNRDIKPGGLAEYGIYFEKHSMKEGLRKQFRAALEQPNIEYHGNLAVGQSGDLTLDELLGMGFDAVLVSAGAQGTKSLGLPGENLAGVYHAKEVVYAYNQLPPFSQKPFRFGRRAAIIGAGNVMVDIARYLLAAQKVEEVTAVVRRGPGEVNFTKDEMKHIIAYLDMVEFDSEIERIAPAMRAAGLDPQAGRQKILESQPKAEPRLTDGKFRFAFLNSPVGMFGADGALNQLEAEENLLTVQEGKVSAKGTGQKHILPVDSVIFAIGDKVDESFGLPTARSEFVKRETPRFPIEGVCYESSVAGVFVGGWSRKASDGLVGYARRDGVNAAKAVWQYLQTQTPNGTPASLKTLDKPIISKTDVARLESIEAEEAKKCGLAGFKFDSNEEMLQAIGLTQTA